MVNFRFMFIHIFSSRGSRDVFRRDSAYIIAILSVCHLMFSLQFGLSPNTFCSIIVHKYNFGDPQAESALTALKLTYVKLTLNPIWFYDIQIWISARRLKPGNLERQVFKRLGMVGAPCFIPNSIIKSDLGISIQGEIQ